MPDPKQPCSPHGWTLDTLEKYLSEQLTTLKDSVRDQDARNLERFAAAKEAVNAALAAADKALAKAESASERRFEGLNELRAMAGDQGRIFLDQIKDLMPRQEYTVQHQALGAKVDEINHRLTTMLPNETFVTQVKAIFDRFEAINGLVAANASRVTSIEASLREKKESTAAGISMFAILAGLVGASVGAIIGHFFK